MRGVPGTPDLCWKGRRIAVFVDSAWWHGHPTRWTPGRHPPNWDAKIRTNRQRDEEVNRLLDEAGWKVLRIWDFELDDDVEAAVAAVKAAISDGC
jgi:DNA mismatch endonuclease (patch repair protein)